MSQSHRLSGYMAGYMRKEATPVMRTLGEKLSGVNYEDPDTPENAHPWWAGPTALDIGTSAIPFVGLYNAAADFSNMVADKDLTIGERIGKGASGAMNTALSLPGAGLVGALVKGGWKGGAKALPAMWRVWKGARRARAAGAPARTTSIVPEVVPGSPQANKWLRGEYTPFGHSVENGSRVGNAARWTGNKLTRPIGVGMFTAPVVGGVVDKAMDVDLGPSQPNYGPTIASSASAPMQSQQTVPEGIPPGHFKNPETGEMRLGMAHDKVYAKGGTNDFSQRKNRKEVTQDPRLKDVQL